MARASIENQQKPQKPLSNLEITYLMRLLPGSRPGVIGALASPDGVRYVFPMPSEDYLKPGLDGRPGGKYDFVVSGKPGRKTVLAQGKLGSHVFGTAGGGVIPGETSLSALERELFEELFAFITEQQQRTDVLLHGESVPSSLDEFKRLFGPVIIVSPGNALPFQVLQIVENGIATIRGVYTLWHHLVHLSPAQIAMLEYYGLRPARSVPSGQLRPYLQVMRRQGDLARV